MKKSLSLILAVVFVLTALCCVACGKHNCTSKCSVCGGCTDAKCTEKECAQKCTCYKDLTNRSATGSNGVVTSSNVEASRVGWEILEDGGHANDAAIAMAFAIGVAEPNASGVGGGGVMIGYNASTQLFDFYNFREFAPAAATYEAIGRADKLHSGALSIGVPTEVSGLLTIFEECGSGKYTRAQILQPAIDLASKGFEVSARLSSNAQFVLDNELLAGEEALELYCPSGVAGIKQGKTLINENYAKVLQAIADNGKDGFYSGWVAEAIISSMQENGGLITQADLDRAKNEFPKKGEALHGTYNGYDVYTAGLPSGGGVVLLETLNMLEKYATTSNKALATYQHNSADYVHLVGTALQLSYADKRHYVADIDNVPVNGLINKDYASERINVFDVNAPFLNGEDSDYGGACGVDPFTYNGTVQTKAYSGTGSVKDNGTTAFTVVDSQGNVASFTKTINGYWGSYIMPQGTGFFLNNELADFSYDQNNVNVIAPNKQPTSSICPTVVLKDGKPVLCVACPGGIVIPTAVAQVVLNVLDFGMDIQDAIDAFRFQNLYVEANDRLSMSAGQTVTTHKLLSYEANGLDADVLTALSAMNYSCAESPTGVTHVYGISIKYEGDNMIITGGADTRRDGKSLAY